MRVQVLFHDRCFDGLASAATFTRFYRERVDPSAEFGYRGLTHRPGTSFTPDVFTDAPVHACVDFRYSPSEKLTWWFDHHQSAFEQPEHEAHFRAHPNDRHFHDPHAQSCTKFLAGVAREKFGFDPAPLADLIHWADLIDGAKFPDARSAVALEAPALKLMLLAEATPDAETLLPKVIRALVELPLDAVVASPLVAEPLAPLLRSHFETVALVRSKARLDRGVVTFDVADEGLDNFNKFIAYDAFPEAAYTVAVSRGAKRSKVSVGSNPWAQERRTHNIAQLCESYGGGGHPAVGAVSFAPDRLDEARRVARELIERLQG